MRGRSPRRAAWPSAWWWLSSLVLPFLLFQQLDGVFIQAGIDQLVVGHGRLTVADGVRLDLRLDLGLDIGAGHPVTLLGPEIDLEEFRQRLPDLFLGPA